MSHLTLTLFGSPRLTEEGDPVDLPSRKALALLAYLTVTGVRHQRTTLAAMLWPESDRERAQNVFRYTLSLLRRALKGQWLVSDRETLALDGSQEEGVDVLRFRYLLDLCQTHGHTFREVCLQCLPLLEQAVALYRGDFMAGFSLSDSVEFDMWQSLEAEARRQELAGALERLVEGLGAQGEEEQASAYAKRWLSLDPLDEAAHRALMRLYAGFGHQAAALRQYEACERMLRDELGVSPSQETSELAQAIRERQLEQVHARPTLISALREVQCPQCGADNTEGASFCMRCGARLTLACPQCGTELPSDPGARFCPSCGAQVVDPPPATPADTLPERLQRLMPAEFAQRLLTTPDQGGGERRIVTILSAECRGFTPTAARLDPEELMEISGGALDPLIEPITRCEGTLARLMGDAILAFFGAPIAHEDDPERACRAALEMVEGARAYAVRLEEERGLSGFGVRGRSTRDWWWWGRWAMTCGWVTPPRVMR